MPDSTPLPERPTPSQAWAHLLSGNRRFLQDLREHPDQDRSRRLALTEQQRPFGLVFGCSDSRVPAELVFDQGLGSLFVVRTAGHVPDTACLGSIEFGVELLEIPLLVVLGHVGCGAVSATVDTFTSGETPGGWVRDLVERISPTVIPAVRRGEVDVNEIVARHVVYTVDLLTERSLTVARRLEQGSLAVVGAVYDLERGVVEQIHALGEV